MMIECPRCGFSQPKDRFCASCGVDMDALLAKPKPFWMRTLQNPSFHLGLIGFLVAVVVGYIFYSQKDMVQREVGQFLDMPISSREAGEAESEPEREQAKSNAQDPLEPENADQKAGQTLKIDSEAMNEIASAQTSIEASAEKGESGSKNENSINVQDLEISYWEIPRDSLNTLVAGASSVVNSNGGRGYLLKDLFKFKQELRKNAQPVASTRRAALKTGSMLPIETPATAVEPFQYGLYVTIEKWESPEASVKFDSTLVLPQPEDPRAPRAAFRGAIEAQLQGTSVLKPQEALVLVMKVENRAPAAEYLNKAGEGPWSVFSSQEFRADLTDWIAVIQLR